MKGICLPVDLGNHSSPAPGRRHRVGVADGGSRWTHFNARLQPERRDLGQSSSAPKRTPPETSGSVPARTRSTQLESRPAARQVRWHGVLGHFRFPRAAEHLLSLARCPPSNESGSHDRSVGFGDRSRHRFGAHWLELGGAGCRAGSRDHFCLSESSSSRCRSSYLPGYSRSATRHGDSRST